MPVDRYRNRLRHAAWTWRESKVCRMLLAPRSKDRASGRSDKRSAKQEDRREAVNDMLDGDPWTDFLAIWDEDD